MKYFILYFLFLVSSNFVKAHKPKVRIETFRNVKTYFNSEFNFNPKTIASEELKIRVIGQLSRVIAEKLGYSDTIMIERKTYYSHDPHQKFFILENNNSQYKLAVLDDGTVLKSNNKGLAVRILSENINVVDVLKLVEYSILNRKKLNKKLIPTTYFFEQNQQLSLLVNSEEFIQRLCKSKSKLVNEVIGNEIELLDNGFLRTKISWKSGKFVFGINNKYPASGDYYKSELSDYEIEDFKYYVDSVYSNCFLIFHNSKEFTYFDGENENTSATIKVENDSWYPFQLSKDRFDDKVILFNNNRYFYVYNFKKKLLKKIE
ncbi:hypothetical protein [Chryseobacterium sediminis]|uniref:Uncharacterized protein n=1 Tax=Chryseobacterium sediminis TaxID=1679494 RepID=A0A5B2TU69_9FLAO|nr:hypothetical protein [Chryseobacterium sediminis]KAA2217789.1 hypothetical protein FW780_19365 [Chryseobacterium sediminis]